MKNIWGEGKIYDDDSVEHWKTNAIPEILQDYDLNDIFNADETGLFYKLIPNRTYEKSNIKPAALTKVKDRVSVLLCSNATGLEKKIPWVIGKHLKPRCFKSVNSLPVIYRANSNAWMARLIFEEFIVGWDKELTSVNRKICLIVDNCASHILAYNPKSIKSIYLPPNTTEFLQPLDQGVINLFKLKIRTSLAQRMLCIIDQEPDKDKLAEVFIKAINILDCLTMIDDSWKKLESKSISACFTKAFLFTKNDHELYDSDITNSEDFSSIDELAVSNEPGTLEVSEIIEQLGLNSTKEAIGKEEGNESGDLVEEDKNRYKKDREGESGSEKSGDFCYPSHFKIYEAVETLKKALIFSKIPLYN